MNARERKLRAQLCPGEQDSTMTNTYIRRTVGICESQPITAEGLKSLLASCLSSNSLEPPLFGSSIRASG